MIALRISGVLGVGVVMVAGGAREQLREMERFLPDIFVLLQIELLSGEKVSSISSIFLD